MHFLARYHKFNYFLSFNYHGLNMRFSKNVRYGFITELFITLCDHSSIPDMEGLWGGGGGGEGVTK